MSVAGALERWLLRWLLRRAQAQKSREFGAACDARRQFRDAFSDAHSEWLKNQGEAWFDRLARTYGMAPPSPRADPEREQELVDATEPQNKRARRFGEPETPSGARGINVVLQSLAQDAPLFEEAWLEVAQRYGLLKAAPRADRRDPRAERGSA